MKLKYKYFYNFEIFFLILFLIILFFPRIDLIEIPGYWQGIRIEDISLVFFSLMLLFNYEERVINNKIVRNFLPLLFYFLIIFFSSFIGKLSNIQIEYISLVRLMEYFLIILLACNLNVSKEDMIKYLKLYLIANLVFIILQKANIMGSFTSIGYLEPSHPQNTRSIGLTGGSWELGVIFSICYFILAKIEKPKLKILAIYFIITLFVNIISENRMNAIGFLAANIFLLKHQLSRTRYLSSLIILVLVGLISLLYLESSNFTAVDRLVNTKYSDALVLVKDFFVFQELPLLDSLDYSVWSLWYRLSLWSKLIIPYLDNFFTVVFGGGLYAIYFESTLLRVIFTTGIIGFIYVAYHAKNLEIYIFAYFLLVGLTLDIFNSMKIFSFTMLYYRLSFNDYRYRRN